MTNALKDHPSECFDVIESDYNLRLILRGLGLRLIDDDFLRFHTEKRYDLVLMNPPFSEGPRHLIHAIELMENGGQIVSLLNASAIRNPYNNERKLLQKLLAEHNARVEFVKNGFKQAERKTDVEVAIIYINICAKRRASSLFENARKAAEIDIEAQRIGRDDQLVVSDEVEQMIAFFNAEAKAGIELLKTFDELTPHIMDGETEYAKPMLQICVGDHKYSAVSNEVVNEYMQKLRYKYWKMLLNRPSLKRKMTSAISNEYNDKIREMEQYDFNRHNIAQVLFDIQAQLAQGVEDAIVLAGDKNLVDGGEEIADIPEDLLQVLRYADSRDCDWVMFDCDAEEIGDLPTYREEWDKYLGYEADPAEDSRAEKEELQENTRVHYMYRDASNYKIGLDEILQGRLTENNMKTFNKKQEGINFHPAELGFNAETFVDLGYDPHEDDPDCHEFCWLEYTTERATVSNLTIEEFVDRFPDVVVP